MHLCYRVLGERCVGVSVMYHGARQTPRAITFLQTEHSFSPLLTIKICHPPSTISSKNPLPSATTLSKLFIKYLFSNQPKSICFIFYRTTQPLQSVNLCLQQIPRGEGAGRTVPQALVLKGAKLAIYFHRVKYVPSQLILKVTLGV